MKRGNVFKVIIAIAVSELAGIIGSVFTMPAIPEWYASLIKPALAPPSWVFGPVWVSLFALMGVASFLVWQKGLEQSKVKIALSLFIVQLILNVAWSAVFFGLRDPGMAFVEIIILWIAIFAAIVAFAKVSKTAAFLLLPYLAWVSFASYLNFAIWSLNT